MYNYAGVTLLTEIIFGGFLGIVAGLAFQQISAFQIKRRTDETAKIETVNNPVVVVLWVVISALLFGLIYYLEKDPAKRVEKILYISIAISIAVVDMDIKKIPNFSVLALLIIKVVSMVYAIVKGGEVVNIIFPAVIGLAVGFFLYQIPMLFHIPIGTGDVKYCGAIGFCLGIFSFIQAALIMAIALLLYLLYLVSTKKGSIKTAVPMGPYLSLGVVITILYPILDKFIDIF